MPDPAPAARTLLGFDFGARRVGVAIGNTITGHARPLAIIRELATDRRFSVIGGLVNEWRPVGFVVGRPLHPDGAAHAVTAAAERFARQLEGRFRRPVVLVDERYSTAEARARARDEGESLDDGDDAHAAAVILEQYLHSLAVAAVPGGAGADPTPKENARP